MGDRRKRLAALLRQLGAEEQVVIEKLLSGLEAGSDLERSGLVGRGRTLRLAQTLGLASEGEEERA